MSRLALVLVLVVVNVCATLAAPAPVTYDQQQTGDLNVQVHLKDIQIVALLDSSYLEDYADYDYAYDYSDFTIKPITPATPHATTSGPGPSGSSTTSVVPWNSWPTISGPPSSSSTTSPETVTSSPQSSSTTVETGAKESETAAPVASSSVRTPEGSLEPKATVTRSETTADNADDGDNIDPTNRKDEKNEKDEIAAIPAPDQLQASVSSTEGSPSSVESAVPETIQAPTDQPQVQQTRKCTTGYTRDRKGKCRRAHIRRRIPSSLLPFGIRLAPRINRHRDQRSETESA